MSDDQIEVRPVDVFEWVRVLDSIDFSATVAAKGVAGRTIKGLAYRLALWANRDGTQVLTGPARISVIYGADYKTAKTVLAVLRKCGLLEVVQRGRGPASKGGVRVGDEYRLTVPLRPDEVLRVRSKEEIESAIEAVKEANRRKPTGNARPRNRDEIRGSRAPVTQEGASGVTGEMVPEDDELRGKWFRGYGVNGSAIPTQDLPLENHPPISLSGDHPSVPATREPSFEDRERDDQASPSTTNPSDPRRQWVINHGAPAHLAEAIIRRIEQANPNIAGFGWWVTTNSNSTLAVHVAQALAAAGSCQHCHGTGKVPGRSRYGDTSTERDCPACTPLSSDDIRAFMHTLTGQPNCPHGYEGGNVPMPERGWMTCADCRRASGYLPVKRQDDRQPRSSERDGRRILKNSHANLEGYLDDFGTAVGAHRSGTPESAETRKAREYLEMAAELDAKYAAGPPISEAEQARRRARGVHVPYFDPADQSVYDQPL